MTFNKYEGLLGSVKKANKFANRMNAVVTAVREAGHPVCSRDLRGLCPNPNYYLDMLVDFGVLSVETRAEEFIHIKVDEYLYGNNELTHNSDGTITIKYKWHDIPVVVHEPTIEFNPSAMCHAHIKGYQVVQVKRKYWTWKV